MNQDLILNKKESVERCIKQVRQYYKIPSDEPFEENHLKQDAIAINLQRACELCIDLANHTIKSKKLGLPKESKESFRLLAENKIITKALSKKLEGMVGFRNILVHGYQQLNIEIMVDIIENRLDDLLTFTNAILKITP